MAKQIATKRPYGGRKKATDKKIPVQVYILESEVKALGGIVKVRKLALDTLSAKSWEIIFNAKARAHGLR